MADLFDKNEDGTYVGLDFTNFPAEVDSWEDSEDIDSSNLPFVNAYREALLSNNIKGAQQILLGHPSLARMRIDASTINKIKHAVMALERMFKEDIQDYIIDTSSAITGIDATLSIRGAPADAAATGSAIKEINDKLSDGSSHNHDDAYLKLTGGQIEGNLHVVGEITATGEIMAEKVFGAVYNDYAEFFPRGEDTSPGDIIALDCNSDIEKYCKATNKSKRVVGVHSDEFGHLIGGEIPLGNKNYFDYNIEKYIPVGLVGRVRTKVIGKIKIGDYIVPSDIPGVGRAYMESDNPETIIGYAVEQDDKESIRRIKVKLKG